MTNLVINMSGLPKQQYISWKGTSTTRNHTTNSAVPSNSNPASIEQNSNPKYTGKANPIKHWRKQLIPAQGIGSGKVSVSQVMDRPGGSTLLVNHLSSDCSNCPQNMKNYISKDMDTQNCSCNTYNPAKITRTASTVINKKYYTSSKAYLKSRVKLYDQNQTLSNKTPSNSPNFNSTNCCDYDCSNNCKPSTIIYKPNNSEFSKEGAVTSSNRIVKLNYDTIQNIKKENNKCCSENDIFNGLSQNALQYRGNFEAPYYLKSKIELPKNQCQTKRTIDGRQPSGGSGIHTVCFPTISSDLEHKKGTLLSSQIGPGTGKLITKQLTNNQISNMCNNKEKYEYLINKLKLPCELGDNIKRWNTLKNDCNCENSI